MIQIRDREEYDYATKRGFNPLLDYKHFKMDIRLRIEIQNELFGRGVIDTMKANEKFSVGFGRINRIIAKRH